jgi:hypothetical protein
MANIEYQSVALSTDTPPTNWEYGYPSTYSDIVKNIRWNEPEQHCLLDAFFKEQQKLPVHMRSEAAMISCPCRKCNPAML